MQVLIILFVLLVIYLLIKLIWKKDNWKTPTKPFPAEWRTIIAQLVAFYNTLSDEEKKHFEYEVQEFLLNYRITGIETDVSITDKLLVAASAVIPIFKFPDWKYTNLSEVLLYPSSFNDNFETKGDGRSILGMVGTGYLEGKMILSKHALHHGFSDELDKRNTAIHEFVHLIDKQDGTIDGIPKLLLQQQYVIPWLELVNKEIEALFTKHSDINPYGGTNRGEFFSVACEYFFERPQLLKSKHPKLYDSMEEIFNHNMASRNLKRKTRPISRNSPCPCNSGKKFKHCCGAN